MSEEKKTKEENLELNSDGKDLFFAMDEEDGLEKKKSDDKASFLISTDSFSSLGLDLVFELSKEAGFDGIDLAIRKNYDARNVDYVKKLMKTHDMPVKVIQVSDKVNQKELNKALDLCEATGADTITINAPTFFDMKTYNFIVDNIDAYKKENKHIHFAIINPENANIFALPIPKYRFSNIVEIVKKYGCYLGFDLANFDPDTLENEIMRKLKNILPYVAVLYFSDKSRLGEGHILPGDGILKLGSFLKKVKQIGFSRYFSSKIKISKTELSDSEKLKDILEKARKYYGEHFENVKEDD